MMINKRLIAMVPEATRYIIRKVLASWFSLLASILLWFSVAWLLEGAYENTLATHSILACFVMCTVCIAVRFALTRIAATQMHKASACVKLRLRSAMYDKLRALGGAYLDAFSTAEVVQLAGEGTEQLETYFGGYLPQFFYAMLAPVTLFFVFLPLSPMTAVVLFLCVPLIPVAIVAVQRVAKRLLGKYWDAYANLGDSFLENLQGLTTLKVYAADEKKHQQMNVEAEAFRVATMRVLTMQLNSVTVMDLVAYGGTALGSILGARAFLLGQVQMGGAVAMILLASEFFLSMRALGSYFHVAMNGMAASNRMFQLLDLPEGQDGTKALTGGDIVAQNMCFQYAADKDALHNLTFSIPQGGLVAVVGESGCGKSTLAALLSGMRRTYTGALEIGGVELRDATAESMRKHITVVSSDSYLFAGTVRSTLLEGRADASEEAMRAALRQVRLLDSVIQQGGLDMPLSERASNLSGGQRQRLALARALLKDSPIYIFDEVTSNIDAEGEAAIMEAIRQLRGTHTILLISHRLANVTDCDEIMFLEHGDLCERGTHTALLEQQGRYAAMYQAQWALEHLERREA